MYTDSHRELIIPNIRLLEIGRSRATKDSSFDGGGVFFNRLYLIEEGEVCMTRKSDHKNFTLNAKKAYLIPCGAQFVETLKYGLHSYFIHFTAIWSIKKDVFLGNKDIVECEFEQRHFDTLENFISDPSLKNRMKCLSVVSDLISELVNFSTNNDTIEKKYQREIEYIHNNPSCDFKLTDLNVQNPYEFSRKFKKDIGMSVKEYSQTILMDNIKEEIIGTNLSIKEIAEKFGFCDQYYFSSFFKKFEGISPNKFRESVIR